MPPTLNEYRDRAHANAVLKGFWSHDDLAPEHARIATRLALVHSEVSEALEELRRPEFNPSAFMEEIADVIIRLMDVAAYYGMDVDGVVTAKMDKNAERPPMHGKVF